MSPLDPLGPLLAHIRSQALAWKRKQPGSSRVGGEEDTASAESSTDLLGTVTASIAKIPADLPDRRRRAFRMYLQAVLAREFGVPDPNAAEFQDLVQRVVSSMEGDPNLGEAMGRAGDILLARAGG